MKVYKGVIVQADDEEINLFQNVTLSNNYTFVNDQSDEDIVEATEAALRAKAHAKTLRVTPSVLSVKPGTTAALRVRSNCAWRVDSYPDGAVLSCSEGFGNGCIEVSAPEGVEVSGTLVARSTDGSAESSVSVIATDLPETPTE